MKIQDFEFELKETITPIEAIPFIPFFQRFLGVMYKENSEDPRIKKLETLGLKLKSDMENIELQDEFEKLANMLQSEKEIAFMNFFGNINKFEWDSVCSFLTKIIVSWNIIDKDSKVLPITKSNVEFIPPMYLIPLLELIAVRIMTGRRDEINFFQTTSEESQVKSKEIKKAIKQ